MTALWINPLLFCVGLLLMLTSLTGNLLIVFALTFKKRTRLPAFNILMLGQIVISLTDVAMNMPLTAVSAFHGRWPLDHDSGGFHLCRFHAFFNSVIPTTRIVLIALMALDRMVAIYSPINYPDRVTRERAWCMIVYCWLHAFAIYISMLAGATPVSYREDHYSCLIASSAPDSYVIVMATFGYVIPVLFSSIFLLMILKKYIVQEPSVSVVEDTSGCQQGPSGDSSLSDNRLARKKLKSKSSYRSMTDYEVSGYVSILFLVWLLCQSPLFVTLTSDMILSKGDSFLNHAVVNNSSSMQHNLNVTNSVNITVFPVVHTNSSVNSTSNVTAVNTERDRYRQMFPPEFQTTIQFLNFVPSLATPILTFVLYRSVWSRLRHVVAKSRLTRRHNPALSIEDESMSLASDTTPRVRTTLQNTTTNRPRQRVRHRNRLAVDVNPDLPEASVTVNSVIDTSGEEQSNNQRPMGRLGTPVLMATSDGLLLHQIIRNRPLAGADVSLEYVVDENGFFGNNGESDADGPVESDCMTSSCNSTKHLLHGCGIVHLEPIADSNSFHAVSSPELGKASNGDATNDSGIEDSPTAKPKNESISEISPVLNQLSVPAERVSKETVVVLPASASNIRPELPYIYQQPSDLSNDEPAYYYSAPRSPTSSVRPVSEQNSAGNQLGFPLNIGEKARHSVNLTVRRILGSSPKVKYRASVFTVSSSVNDDNVITAIDHTQLSIVGTSNLKSRPETNLFNSNGTEQERNVNYYAPSSPKPKTVHINSSSSVTPYTSVFNSNSEHFKNDNVKY